jgi:hypothetical protein
VRRFAGPAGRMVARRVRDWVFFEQVFRQLSPAKEEPVGGYLCGSRRQLGAVTRRRIYACLLRLICGVYPGLDDVAVALKPGFHALDRIPGLVDVGLQLVDLLLAE